MDPGNNNACYKYPFVSTEILTCSIKIAELLITEVHPEEEVANTVEEEQKDKVEQSQKQEEVAKEPESETSVI